MKNLVISGRPLWTGDMPGFFRLGIETFDDMVFAESILREVA
jgi:hypothetical protein